MTPHAENLAARLERAAREHTRRPGDEYGQGGWMRPYLLPASPKPDNRALAIRLLFLLAVAFLLTLIVVAFGAHAA